MTRRKVHRARVRTNCQHTERAETAARRKWRIERHRRARILRRGNAGIGYLMAREHGYSERQYRCLDTLWGVRESGWSTTSGSPGAAYGIPQSLPGSKMASAGPNWMYNPRTQIRWGLRYIAGRWGTACAALANSYSSSWY